MYLVFIVLKEDKKNSHLVVQPFFFLFVFTFKDSNLSSMSNNGVKCIHGNKESQHIEYTARWIAFVDCILSLSTEIVFKMYRDLSHARAQEIAKETRISEKPHKRELKSETSIQRVYCKKNIVYNTTEIVN